MSAVSAFWAFVDADGVVVTVGSGPLDHAFLQDLPAGLVAVGRPEHVRCGWRLVGGAWVEGRPPRRSELLAALAATDQGSTP